MCVRLGAGTSQPFSMDRGSAVAIPLRIVGIVSAISDTNRKVIDVRIMSKYCRCSGRLNKVHDATCISNYSGVSGGMESKGISRNVSVIATYVIVHWSDIRIVYGVEIAQSTLL